VTFGCAGYARTFYATENRRLFIQQLGVHLRGKATKQAGECGFRSKDRSEERGILSENEGANSNPERGKVNLP